MISFLQGKIILKNEKYIVLDVNNVGYKVFLSQKSLLTLPEIGRTIKLFCFLNVKENGLDLYGFLDEKELDFFEMLNNISGIGPKAALEIASVGPLEKLKDRILAQDTKIFEGIHGVGRKKAMAIMLELTGKIKELAPRDLAAKKEARFDEAENALMGLGFTRQKAKDALGRVPKEIIETGQRVKEALKNLGK